MTSDLEYLLIGGLTLVVLVGVIVVTAAIVIVAWFLGQLFAPATPTPTAPRIFTEEEEAKINGATGWDTTDPTDALIPPPANPGPHAPAWHRPPPADPFLPLPSRDGIDLTGDVGQLDPMGGVDEPTILGDGTVILHGEIVRDGGQ